MSTTYYDKIFSDLVINADGRLDFAVAGEFDRLTNSGRVLLNDTYPLVNYYFGDIPPPAKYLNDPAGNPIGAVTNPPGRNNAAGGYETVMSYLLGYGIDTRKPDPTDPSSTRFPAGSAARIKNVVDFCLVAGFIEHATNRTTPLDFNKLYLYVQVPPPASVAYHLENLKVNADMMKTQFNIHVLPKFQEYFNAYLERTNVPQNAAAGGSGVGPMSLQMKATYQAWYDETLPDFYNKFLAFSKDMYMTVARNASNGGRAYRKPYGIRGGWQGSSLSDFGDVKVGDKQINYFINYLANQVDLSLRPATNTDGMLELFGWKEWAESKAPDDWGFPFVDDGDDGDRSAQGYEEAVAAGSDFAEEMAVSVLSIDPDASEDDLLSFRQCALMTDLLRDYNQSAFSDYWTFGDANSNNKWNSPLNVYYQSKNTPDASGNKSYTNMQTSPNAAHNRIYPVTTFYDSTNFVNHASVDRALMQRTFMPPKSTAQPNDNNPVEMGKDLFWVYEDSQGNIREKLLAKSSYADGAINRQILREANELQRIYDTITDPFAQATAVKRLTALSKSVNGVFPTPGNLPDFIEDQRSALIGDEGNNDKAYFALKNVNIKFEGTNISTARKDVQVELSWEVGDIGSLEVVLAHMKPADFPPVGVGDKVRLIDLVTLPLTNSPSVRNGPNQWLSNQYSPNYSRLRLKVSPVESPGQTISAQDTSTMIVDLTTIDHSITRDDDSGRVEFTINYRGFFETSLDMPYNDVLADDATMKSRKKRQEDALDELTKNNCDPRLVRKVMRMEQEAFAREARSATYSTIIKKLQDLNLVHTYSLIQRDFEASIVGNTFVAQKNLVKTANPGGPAISLSTFTTLKEELTDTDDESGTADGVADIIKNEELIELKNRFIFLGDLMWVAADCLYEKDSAEMQKHVDNLNMRFMVLPINVPTMDNPDKMVSINPLSLPLDLSFFIRWFDENITNKGVSFYPIGSFIRDIIDKLVNSLVYDVCFNNLLPDETPCILRGQMFTTTNENFFTKSFRSTFPRVEIQGTLNPDIFAADTNIFPKSAAENPGVLTDTNYYVIYPLVPSFKRNQQKGPNEPTLKEMPYTISFYSGINMPDWNFLTGVTFSKVTSGNLREARYFNNSFGSLSLLSNVYDLSFTLYRRKANTFLYPGSVINFYLLDFGDVKVDVNTPPWTITDYDDSDPHREMTTANILGFGGYFIIKSVEYNLGEVSSEFEIKISSKYLGSDAQKAQSRLEGLEDTRTKIPKKCADAYNIVARRVNELAQEGDETYPPETRGSASITTPDINANNQANRAPGTTRAAEAAPTPAAKTAQTSVDVRNIATAGMGKGALSGAEIPSSSLTGPSWKTKQTYKYDSDGKKLQGDLPVTDPVAAEVATKIQEQTREFNSDFNETILYQSVSNSNLYYKVRLSVKTNKSFTLSIQEYEDTSAGD